MNITRSPPNRRRLTPDTTLISSPKSSHGVTKTIVPLHPIVWKTTELVAAWANIPRFSNEFNFCKGWILSNCREKTTVVDKVVFSLASSSQYWC